MRHIGLFLAVVVVCGVAGAATIQDGLFVIDYPEGREDLARQTLSTLQKARQEFAIKLPAGDAPIHVLICGSLDDFGARTRRSYSQVEGVADSEQGSMVLKAPELRRKEFDYLGTVRHELVHVLLGRNTARENLPRWLNEGIAMVVGKDYRYESMFRVARAYLQGRLIDYRSLNFAFVAPHTDLEFGDAYAQSLSMTRFLIEQMGEAAFWEMVHSLKTDHFAHALESRTGLTPSAFYAKWKGTLWKVALVASLVSGFSVFQLMAFLLIAAYWRKHRRKLRVLRQWEEEEAEEQGGIFLASNLEDTEPPYPWEQTDEDER